MGVGWGVGNRGAQLAGLAPIGFHNERGHLVFHAHGLRMAQANRWRERRAAAVRAGELGLPDVAECDEHLVYLEEQARAANEVLNLL